MGSNAEPVRDVEPAPSKAGLWEDFVDIFYAPSSVFARRADGKFGLPLLFLVVIGTILFFLTKNAMQPIMDAEFARQSAVAMRKNPSLTQDQLATGKGFFETVAPFFFAIGLLSETLHPLEIAGGVLIFAGIVLERVRRRAPTALASGKS